MARALPTWPWLLFGVIEPLLLLYAAVTVYLEPTTFAQRSSGSDSKSFFTPSVPGPLSPGSLVITYQLANIYVLIALVQTLCTWSPHADVARNYVAIVALADLGHIYATYLGMGEGVFWNWRAWNDLAWGNVGASAFLCVNRVGTVLGVFGGVGGGRGKVRAKNA